MITRFLGFINRIVVARLMGEEGVGLYMMALPTLFLVITLTQFGLPVAISKRVAEADARGDTHKIKRILVISILLTMTTSVIFTIGMILAAPFISHTLLTDERTALPLIAISPIVPIVAMSSIIKGYFQGKQNMKPQSYAIVIEQIVRITCVALFVKLLMPFGIEYAAAGAMISVVLGELVSLLYMMILFKRKKTIKVRTHFFKYLKASQQTTKELLSIALPSTGSRMIGSISHFLEPILVAQTLAIAGITTAVATKAYGELTGYVLPLLFLPTFITQSLSIAIVPSISEAEAKQNNRLVHYRIHQSIRISFASGAISTVVLTLFASPILSYMYGTDHAQGFLILMAPFFLLLYIQSPLQAALQALDLARPAMWNSLIGAIVKFTVLIMLASNPNFGIYGVAISMSVGVVLVTLLHLFSLSKTIRFSIPIVDLFKMVALLLTTWIFGQALKQAYVQFLNNFFGFILALIGLLLIYWLLLLAFRFISKEELSQIPVIKHLI